MKVFIVIAAALSGAGVIHVRDGENLVWFVFQKALLLSTTSSLNWTFELDCLSGK